MGPKVYIGGKLYEKSDAKISVFDHGLLYGDGVFEGIRSYSGKVFRLKEHVDRLYNSAQAIDLSIPMSRQDMGRAVEETLAANKLADAYIRVVVTRAPAAWALIRARQQTLRSSSLPIRSAFIPKSFTITA